MEFLGRVAYEVHLMRPLLPTYLHLLISAIFPIYIAAHSSLARPASAARPSKAVKGDDNDNDEVSQKIESLSASDAVVFPLLAGATLTTLYLLLKWLQDPAWLNWGLGIYFGQIGLVFATKFLKDVQVFLRSFLLPTQYTAGGKLWKVNNEERLFQVDDTDAKNKSPVPGIFRNLPMPQFLNELIWAIRCLTYKKAKLNLHIHRIITLKSSIDILDLSSLLVATAIVGYHTFFARPWFLTNFLGFSFCYGSLQFISPTTAWTGTLILSALFFYDIYFVFFTPMMVTVATKLDVPIKLLFPRPDGCIMPVGAAEGSAEMVEYLQCLAKKRTMAMLGLGDIVIPGMVLAFALRFDLYLFYLRAQSQSDSTGSAKPRYVQVTGGWGERFWTTAKLRSKELQAKSFPKPYFYASVVGYLAGMITTVVVMQVAQHAQPALLYLVPGVLLSLWGTALVKGDLKTLWRYSEDQGEDDDLPKKGDKNNRERSKSDGSAEKEMPQEFSKSTDTTEKDDEEDRDDSEKSCRQLISFSITLAEAKSKDKGTLKARIRVMPPARTRQDDRNTVTSDHNEGRNTSVVDRAGGEPPEKRRRKT